MGMFLAPMVMIRTEGSPSDARKIPFGVYQVVGAPNLKVNGELTPCLVLQSPEDRIHSVKNPAGIGKIGHSVLIDSDGMREAPQVGR